MISSNQYRLTWQHFCDLNQDRRTAFENMCRALFDRTRVLVSDVSHSNPNHPGVEVAPVHSKDGKELISFQAKYFDGDLDYRQIESSIQTAINRYTGEINKIYLYCNKDVTTTSPSYQRIELMAKNAGIELVPITGQSILNDVMNYPPLLACYFGLDTLDKKWFEQNLQIALDNLGRRYNSKFNIDTEARRRLSIFLKDSDGIEFLNTKKVNAIESLKDFRWHCDYNFKDSINKLIRTIEHIPDVSRQSITDVLTWKDSFEKENKNIFDELCAFEEEIEQELKSDELSSEEKNRKRSDLHVISKLKTSADYLAISDYEKSLIISKVLFVTGEMGMGKSQLLATAARESLRNDRMSLLMLGQTFISSASIENQIMDSLTGIDCNESFDSLLAVMEENAYEKNNLSVVYIDAINETRERDLWKEGINRLIAEIEQYDNLLLVVSLRSGFEPLLYSDKVLSNIKKGEIATIIHNGLMDESPKGIFDFLSYYGVPTSPAFYLNHEMTNPLFLTWFCQTYTGEEQGLTELISSVLTIADKEASKECGFSEPIGLLRDLLMEYFEVADAKIVTKKELLALRTWELYSVTNKIAYINAIERAGVLISYLREQDEIFYFGYNLLEDFIQATWIIERQQTKEKIKRYCLANLFGIDSEGRITKFGNESVFAMLASLFSTKFGEECIDIVDAIKESWDRNNLLEAFVKSFTWRTLKFSSEQLIEFVNKYKISPAVVWSVYMECATKDNSILNADGLTQILSNYSLNKRDYLWTTEINNLTEDDRIINLAYFFESGNELEGLSDRTAELLLTLFAWMLSSSNRVLRDRISKSMIEVLRTRIDLCSILLEKFKDVNDPYIIQRLYGVFFGAVIKRTESFDSEFERFACMVYHFVFMQEKVYPDILLRDYARLIIERFIYEYPSKETLFEVKRIRPPYYSDPIPEVAECDYSDEKYQEDGLWRLLYSMKFDLDVKGVGQYGDFGRYVFQSALQQFVSVDEHNIYYYAIEYILNDLGYSNDLFGDYDSNRADFSRHQSRGVERIGKKYEWIAMYNILARLSDTYNIEGNDWNDEVGKAYSGPWNPYVRDFDPTRNVRYKMKEFVFPEFEESQIQDNHFIEKDSSEENISAWVLADDEMYSSFPKRFIRKDKNGVEWISMYLYQELKKTIPGTEEYALSLPHGEQHIWSISAMHIAEADQELSIDKLIESRYLRKHAGMNTMRDCYTLFSREYAWSPGYTQEFEIDEYEDEENTIKAFPAVINAMWEEQYDASQEETTSYYFPSGTIIKELGLHQKMIDGVFFIEDELVAFDTRIIGDAHGELLIRKDALDLFVHNSKMKLFWDVVGEKQFFLGGNNQKWQRREGYYLYESESIDGKIDIVPN